MGKTKEAAKGAHTTATVGVKHSKESGEVGDNGGHVSPPLQKSKFDVELAINKLLAVCESTDKKVDDVAGRVLLLENDYDQEYRDEQPVSELDSFVSYRDREMPRLDNEVMDTDSASHISHKDTDAEDIETKGRFDDMLTGFTKVESTGPPVDDKLAKAIDLVFATGMSGLEFEAASNSIDRPENCANLRSVRVNTPVWGVLNRRTRYIDEKLQEVQTSLIKATSELAQLMSTASEESPVIRAGITIVGLLGNANAKLNQTRRSAMRPDLEKTNAHLYNSTQTTTDTLFGEEGDRPIKEAYSRTPQRAARG